MSGSVWFDPSQYDPSQLVPQLPVGNGQVAIIIDGKREAVKDKPNAGMLVFTVKIVDGPNTGAVGAYRLNLWSDSEQAKDIANRQFSALCYVTVGGHIKISSPNASELFNKPFRINVSKQTTNPEYTQITGVTDINGNQPTRQAPASQQQPAPGYAAPPINYAGLPNPAQSPGWAPAPTGAPAEATPSWQPPPTGGAPMQPQQPQGQPAQPSWAQQPAGAAKPSWAT